MTVPSLHGESKESSIYAPIYSSCATRITNIFVIGEGSKAWVSLPKGKGTKLTIAEERDVRRKQRAAEA